MESSRTFKTVVAKLLNSKTGDWKVQIKHQNDFRLNTGNLSEVEIDYRVENQAKFLLKAQQAPALHWFSSQDSLEQLFEKSEISSHHDNSWHRSESTKSDSTTETVDPVARMIPSITEVSSVPELNTLDILRRTRESLQLTCSANISSQSSTSIPASGVNVNTVRDTQDTQSASIASSESDDIIEEGSSLVAASGTASKLCNNRCVARESASDSDLFKSNRREDSESGTSSPKPKIIQCSSTIDGNESCDSNNGAVAVRSAPILPSEQTLFRTEDNVILLVEEQKILVSKVMLSLHSEFFKAMFATDMKESQQSEIELPSIKHHILQQILVFCQKGELSVNSDNVHHLLHTAHQFQICPVVEMCEHFLTHILRQEILLELLDIADHYLLARLLKACFSFIGNKFQQLCIQGILCQLKYDHLLALLESDIHIPDATEFHLFNLVVEWFEKDVKINKQQLEILLHLIRFPLMQTTELSQINKRTETWLQQSDIFQQQMKLAFKYKNSIHEQPLMTGFHTKPRAAIKTIALIVEDDSILSELNSLDCHLVPVGHSSQIPTELFITHKMKLEWSRDGYSVAALNNFMYVGGGYNPSDDRNLSSVHRYNPATCKWVSVQAMRHRRAAFVLCSLGDHLYAIGGRQFDSHLHAAFGLRAKTLNSVECYDCTSDAWSKVANIPVGLFAHAGVSCNGKLYVSGGRTNEPMGMEDTNALICYNSDNDSWEQCAPMRHNRYYHGMTSVDKKLYVAGGVNYNPSDAYGVWNFVTEPETYDTVSGQWTALAHMPHRRSQVAVTAVARKVYVIGGLPHPGVDGKREVLEYSIDKDEWHASTLRYPAFWPTQCCLLYFSPSIIEHSSKVSDFDRDRRHSGVREVLYSLSRVPHA